MTTLPVRNVDVATVARYLLATLGLMSSSRTPRRHAKTGDSPWLVIVVHYLIALGTWSRDRYGVDASAVGRGWRVVASVIALGVALAVWFLT